MVKFWLLSFSILFPYRVLAQSGCSVGVRINPIVHYNYAKATQAVDGKMSPINIGIQAGLEANIHLGDRLTLTTLFKYYRKSQKVTQQQFFGCLGPLSKTYYKWTYETVNVGAVVKYKVQEWKFADLFAVGGLSYSFANQNELNYGWKVRGGSDGSAQLEAWSFHYSPEGLDNLVSMFHPLIGIRARSSYRIGNFEYGLLLYLPTKPIPEYHYDQILQTTNAGNIHAENKFTSRQYSLEVSIIYQIIKIDE